MALIASCGGRSDVGWSARPRDVETSSGGSPHSGGMSSAGGAPVGGTTSDGGGIGAGGDPGAGAQVGAGGVPDVGGFGGFGGALDDDVLGFCLDACSAVPLASGSCADSTVCADPGDCLENAAFWNESARDVFVWCLQNDPLCFTDANTCILERLFPSSTFPYFAAGQGLSMYEGRNVTIAIIDRAAETQIEQGGFSVSFPGPHFGDQGSPFIVWLDVDGDGVCSEELDLFSTAPSEFNNDFAKPSFSVQFEPEDFAPGDQRDPPISCANWF